MRRWLVPLLALPTAALLALAVTVLVVRAEPRRAAPAAPPTTTTPAAPGSHSPPVSADGPIEALVRELQAFVERQRGLAFKTPVKVTLLDDTAFRNRLLRDAAEDREDIEKTQLVLRAMGLLDPQVDLVKAVERVIGTAVVGMYDPETKELAVRGSQPTPNVRATLVHELTHALEDQHFNLHREDLGDEADLGFSALAEGTAVRMEEAYVGSLSEADRRRLRAEEAAQFRLVPRDVPPVVEQALVFPYAYGPDLVEAVVEAGGKGRLDRAFADPPSSTEHVLHPERYMGGDAPRPVPVPKADRPAFDDGEIGELFLILMLRSDLGTDAARRAAKGWGGDRYVAWRDGDRTCVRMDFVMDDAEETEELMEALRDWAGERKGSASASGPSLTTCG